MQIEKKVFSKLFKPKTALSKKVDLSKMNDLDAIFYEANDLDEQIDATYSELRSLATKALFKIEEFESVWNDIEKTTIDLGIDVNEVLPSGYKSRINNISARAESIKSI